MSSGCPNNLTVVPADADGNVQIRETAHAPALLVSEVVAAEDKKSLIKCPILIENRGEDDVEVTLLGTGCSCYGVTLNGELLTVGTPFTVGRHSELTLDMKGTPATVQTTREFSAQFSIPKENGGEAQVRTNCVLNIYKDVRLTPVVITGETELGKSTTTIAPLKIERVLRGESPESVDPEITDLPADVKLVSLKRTGQAEELEPGLWRLTWNAELELHIAEDAAANALPKSYHVRFAAADAEETGQGQIVLRSRSPVAFPSEVHFGRITLGEAASRRFMVATTDDTSFVLNAKTVDGITVSTDEKLAKSHWLNVEVTPRQSGEFQQSLELSTGLREQPTITIRLKALVVE